MEGLPKDQRWSTHVKDGSKICGIEPNAKRTSGPHSDGKVKLRSRKPTPQETATSKVDGPSEDQKGNKRTAAVAQGHENERRKGAAAGGEQGREGKTQQEGRRRACTREEAESCFGSSRSEILPGPPPYENGSEPTEEEEDATSSEWVCVWWRQFLLSVFLCSSGRLVNLDVFFFLV